MNLGVTTLAVALLFVGLSAAACNRVDHPAPNTLPVATPTRIHPTATPNLPTATVASTFAGTSVTETPYGDTTDLSAFIERGNYHVGIAELFFHDPSRELDLWNGQYASDSYQRALAAAREAGEKQIVPTRIWYPIEHGDTARRATFADLYSTNSDTFRAAYTQRSVARFAWSIGASTPSDAVVSALEDRVINAKWNAPIAPGPFPVVIAAHGLGGNSLMWLAAAAHLASHGYVVVATDFISEGSLPNVFDSPDSQFAQSASQQEVDSAYGLILREQKVIPKFYDFFFDTELAEGVGGQLVGEMMQRLFTQRVDDVMTVVDGLTVLSGRDAGTCRSEMMALGQPNSAEVWCGQFTGAFDVSKIGIMGHSLGSITAQFAVAREPRITAAVGYNNGAPRYWEPPGIFGGGNAADGQPAGNPNPVMQIYGSEDAFVQSIFRELMWNQISRAGGDPTRIWTLEQEQVLPTDDNPQPIARNAYDRATGDKAIIAVKDATHGSLIEFPTLELISEHAPLVVDGVEYGARGEGTRPRKSVGEAVLTYNATGPLFRPLGWGEVDGIQMFIPGFVRNYYTRSWFDYYLKGDESGLRFRHDPIPDLDVLDVRTEIGQR